MSNWLAEFASFIIMAVALGLDGFSVSLGLGLQNIRLKRIAIIGISFGSFHILLPFLGLLIGQYIFTQLEYVTTLIGGAILVTIGSYMVFSAFQTKTPIILQPKGLQLLSLSFIVSLDSFPVGVSLGLLGIKMFVIILMFGFITTLLAWFGMIIGKKANHLLGTYSEVLGGTILFVFGIQMIFY